MHRLFVPEPLKRQRNFRPAAVVRGKGTTSKYCSKLCSMIAAIIPQNLADFAGAIGNFE
jgi:hypothetical protein